MARGHRWLVGIGVVLALAAALALIGAGGEASLAVGDIIYVDAYADPGGDGTSWEDAYTDLQEALGTVVARTQIWVAAGTYKPTDGTDRTISFQMVSNVAIYGGFDPSAGATEWEHRDWVLHETILSGNIGDEKTNTDNSYHVFYHDGNLGSTAILDGFTITGGMADLDDPFSPHADGGGMYNNGSSPTLANCTFEGNGAVSGGGMFNDNSSPELTNCTFSRNLADSSGGAIFSRSSLSMLTGCTFTRNAAHYGGGMLSHDSSPTLTNCTFAGNQALMHGGGMMNSGSSAPTLTNCTFEGNGANWGGGMLNSSSPLLINCTFRDNGANYGGGMMNSSSAPTLTNCTFWSNGAGIGGGMYNWGSSSPKLTNCILWEDSPHEIYNHDPDSIPVVTYSDIQGGYPGTGNIVADPLLADPNNGYFQLGPDSPCIDVGTGAAPHLPGTDFEGDPRIMDGNGDGVAIVDMGVDEAFWYPPIHLPLVLRGY